MKIQPIELQEVSTYYYNNKKKVTALENVSLTLNPRERVLITGPTGSGKTSLLEAIQNNTYRFWGTVSSNPDEIGFYEVNDSCLQVVKKFGFRKKTVDKLENKTLAELLTDSYFLNQPKLTEAKQIFQELGVYQYVIDNLDRLTYKDMKENDFRLNYANLQLVKSLIEKKPFVLFDSIFNKMILRNQENDLNFIFEYMNEFGMTPICTALNIEQLKPYMDRILWMESGKIVKETSK